ncbi:beta-ketoacyl synthase N-terminal-like domain-containing protein [Amycolatopsis keratiniphila]|uniref:beta-ketoacyl synthase N-terminal-like domain-containing protein n=1 Tax=Amycolatopsis keratiniphila TaxID=129921 RepID=UPI0033D6F7DA
MSGVVVTGWSALTSAGVGVDALAKRLELAEAGQVQKGQEIGDLYEEPLPAANGHFLPSFSPREHLGRKGTSTYDRATGLAVVCCQEALREAGVTLDDEVRPRIGVVLGTSLGSFKSTSDYTRETLVQEKPYLVNPMLFPNTVMNCAAGQVAIRFGLRGVNTTIAGGTLGFLNALRYAGNAIDRGHVDVVVAGAVEEFTPHRAWSTHLTGATEVVAAGEAAGMFVLAKEDTPEWAGTRRRAGVLAVATAFGPGGGDAAETALAGCVHRVLAKTGANPSEVSTVYTGEADDGDRREYGPIVRALGHRPERVMVKRLFGECDAASGAVALGVLLAEERDARPGGLCLLTARGADGAVGAAIVRRYADGGPDRG